MEKGKKLVAELLKKKRKKMVIKKMPTKDYNKSGESEVESLKEKVRKKIKSSY